MLSSTLTAVPRLLPPPNPSGGLEIRVSLLSNSVRGPAQLFSKPTSCWPENQCQGLLLMLLKVIEAGNRLSLRLHHSLAPVGNPGPVLRGGALRKKSREAPPPPR